MKSPCKNKCYYKKEIGYCTGCGRTLEDIMNWVSLSDEERDKRIKEAKERIGE